MTRPIISQYLETEGRDHPSLLWTGGSVSHKSLKTKILQRMNWLSKQGMSGGDRLVLHLPKSPLSVECLLAGMALGCVVTPIDPKAPKGRVNATLKEVLPVLILNVDNTPEQLDSDIWQGELPSDKKAPALILMTSGSTGTPKGIILSHENISTFVNWSLRTFGLGPEDRFVSIAPFHFDLSMLDVYAGLLAGGTVYLPTEKEIAFPGSMSKIFDTYKPTILYAVPSMLQIFQRFRLFEKIDFSDLRWLLFAGEVFPMDALRKLRASLPDPRMANLFGPTETNVFCWHEVADIPDQMAQLPIGQACDYAQIRIFDDQGRALESGETGEIGVLGPSVMLGYLEKGEIRSPIQYGDYFRTGDFGHMDEQGLLHFAGRQDDMAKIRGIRFRLKEIEALALAEGLCSQAVAILHDKNSLNAHVILHVVTSTKIDFNTEQLKSYLADRLPHQACPLAIYQHIEFPYTSNGKIDRLALSKATKGQTE